MALGLAWAKFQAKGHTLLLPLIEFPAGRVLALVRHDADPDRLQDLLQPIDFFMQHDSLFFGRLCCDTHGHYHDLYFRDTWGQDKSQVITMDHDHNADCSGAEAPGILPDIELSTFFVGWILHDDVEHFAEVLAETMTRATLYAPTSLWNVTFYRCGVFSTREFLFVCLPSPYDRDCQ